MGMGVSSRLEFLACGGIWDLQVEPTDLRLWNHLGVSIASLNPQKPLAEISVAFPYPGSSVRPQNSEILGHVLGQQCGMASDIPGSVGSNSSFGVKTLNPQALCQLWPPAL